MEVPRIYCINLKKSVDRRSRMVNRFKNIGLYDKVTFIDAVSMDSPLIDYYHQNSEQPHSDTKQWRCEMGCFASHLKALRTFLEDGGDEAIICEDDIMFKNNFIEEYHKIRTNVPNGAPIIALSYIIYEWEGYLWKGNDPSKQNVCNINDELTWGTQMYLITKDYAIECLTKYDKPYDEYDYMHVSEVITRNANGYIAYPPIAIEESLDSEIHPDHLEYHREFFSSWNYDNYKDAEKSNV